MTKLYGFTAEPGTSATRVVNQEILKASVVVHQFPLAVQDKVNDFLPDGVEFACEMLTASSFSELLSMLSPPPSLRRLLAQCARIHHGSTGLRDPRFPPTLSVSRSSEKTRETFRTGRLVNSPQTHAGNNLEIENLCVHYKRMLKTFRSGMLVYSPQVHA